MTARRDHDSFYQAPYLIKEGNTLRLIIHCLRLEHLTEVQHTSLEMKMGDSER